MYALIEKGYDLPLVRARLRYAEAQQLMSHYLEKLKKPRIYPQMLPTQVSGRWSTTDPPVANLAKKYKAGEGAVIIPNRGEKWLLFDLDAIEAKILSAFSRDEEDLEAFAKDYDLHTLTAMKALNLPLPPTKTKALSTAEDCAAWRAQVAWAGPKDQRRDLFKTVRYSLQYSFAKNFLDSYKGVLQAKIEFDDATGKPVFSRDQLMVAGKAFIFSKRFTWGVWKPRTWAECIATGRSRTVLGRLRHLFGDAENKAKEGLNHRVQGTVSDMMNIMLRDILAAYPSATLKWNEHDGATIGFPRNVDPLSTIQPMIDRTWDIEGVSIRSTFTHGWAYHPEEQA